MHVVKLRAGMSGLSAALAHIQQSGAARLDACGLELMNVTRNNVKTFGGRKHLQWFSSLFFLFSFFL